MKIKQAIDTLIKEFKKGKKGGSYYHAWQSNIAMSFIDNVLREKKDKGYLNKKDIYKIANNSAQSFLDNLINNK